MSPQPFNPRRRRPVDRPRRNNDETFLDSCNLAGGRELYPTGFSRRTPVGSASKSPSFSQPSSANLKIPQLANIYPKFPVFIASQLPRELFFSFYNYERKLIRDDESTTPWTVVNIRRFGRQRIGTRVGWHRKRSGPAPHRQCPSVTQQSPCTLANDRPQPRQNR